MYRIANILVVIKLYMFRASSVPIIRSYPLYTRQLVRFMHAMWPLPSRDRLEPIAVRTVDNSWWWAQKMPDTCRVLWQIKCWIFDASSWLFYTKHLVFGATAPQWARASSFMRFLDHTQWRTTVGRTPLDGWSAHRRDLYLTWHNTHKRQTSMPPVGFEPTISAGEWPQTYTLDSAATGIDYTKHITPFLGMII